MASHHLNFISRFTTYDHPRRQLAFMLAAIALIMLMASIGTADFSTKGEPREAAVAHAMLTGHNWILPVDSAGDMAYKPPMFHWLVAICCWGFGSMTEFACRLPSALALVALVVMTFSFFSRKSTDGSDARAAVLTALFTLTAFECYRSGTSCRVDMVLTAFMCGGMMSLCKALDHHPARFYMLAIVCLWGAALTKGPVGILLPLAVWWIYGLLRGRNFFFMSGMGLLLLLFSLTVPALYYYGAWLQGGERFYRLAMEENFGRLTGTMSYDSHVKPFWYNFLSLLTGWLPWSLFVAATALILFVRRGKSLPSRAQATGRDGFFRRLRSMDSQRLFSLVAIVVIFVFYTIPKSKRSVYLLPMYPFMAYWLTEYARLLLRKRVLRLSALLWTVVAVCALYPIIYGIVFPAIVNHRSDRDIALSVNRLVPAHTDVYTFIPDRFLRYYVTDHYLGYRMKPLLPSGQTSGSSRVPDANAIRTAPHGVFYLTVSYDVWNGLRQPLGLDAYEKKSDYGLHAWLSAHALRADSLYTSTYSTHDVKGRLVLLRIIPSDTTDTNG